MRISLIICALIGLKTLILNQVRIKKPYVSLQLCCLMMIRCFSNSTSSYSGKTSCTKLPIVQHKQKQVCGTGKYIRDCCSLNAEKLDEYRKTGNIDASHRYRYISEFLAPPVCHEETIDIGPKALQYRANCKDARKGSHLGKLVGVN